MTTTLLIGDYQLLHRLGVGGLAEVWLAHKSGGGPAAIKILLPHLAAEPAARNSLADEFQLARLVEHPHLVRAEELLDWHGRPALVLEFVDGLTLEEGLRRAGPPGFNGAAAVAEAVLRALVYLADLAAGKFGSAFVHRDLCPANLLVDRRGVVKLADLGIARYAGRLSRTVTGQLKGRPRYMAPETLAGKPAAARADLFSLGVALGEVAGEDPPANFRDFVNRLRDDDPERRPETARHALAELQALHPRPDYPTGMRFLAEWMQQAGGEASATPAL